MKSTTFLLSTRRLPTRSLDSFFILFCLILVDTFRYILIKVRKNIGNQQKGSKMIRMDQKVSEIITYPILSESDVFFAAETIIRWTVRVYMAKEAKVNQQPLPHLRPLHRHPRPMTMVAEMLPRMLM